MNKHEYPRLIVSAIFLGTMTGFFLVIFLPHYNNPRDKDLFREAEEIISRIQEAESWGSKSSFSYESFIFKQLGYDHSGEKELTTSHGVYSISENRKGELIVTAKSLPNSDKDRIAFLTLSKNGKIKKYSRHLDDSTK